jgi:DNA-directed RNA polymerase specialized sigma24 family protein
VSATRDINADAARLRDELLRAVQTGAISARAQDAEDQVHDAYIKFLREKPRPGAPSPRVRAHKHLHDVQVDSLRRQQTRATHEAHIADLDVPTPLAAENEMAEIRESLAAIDDSECHIYTLLRLAGYSDNDIATIPGWDRKRVARVRKRLSRLKPELRELFDTQS